jgi:hypothetical protein
LTHDSFGLVHAWREDVVSHFGLLSDLGFRPSAFGRAATIFS